MHIQNVESPFMKLLQLDNLFFNKRVMNSRKGDGFSDKASLIKDNQTAYGGETTY